MTCAALAALAGAVILYVSPRSPEKSDYLVLAPSAETAAELCYHNHAARISRSDDYTLTMGGLSVTVSVHVPSGADEPETITVTPPATMVAEPPTGAAVDGGEFRAWIMWPAS